MASLSRPGTTTYVIELLTQNTGTCGVDFTSGVRIAGRSLPCHMYKQLIQLFRQLVGIDVATRQLQAIALNLTFNNFAPHGLCSGANQRCRP